MVKWYSSSLQETHLRAMERHLPYEITQMNALRYTYRPVLDLLTTEGWKAKLTLVLTIYKYG